VRASNNTTYQSGRHYRVVSTRNDTTAWTRRRERKSFKLHGLHGCKCKPTSLLDLKLKSLLAGSEQTRVRLQRDGGLTFGNAGKHDITEHCNISYRQRGHWVRRHLSVSLKETDKKVHPSAVFLICGTGQLDGTARIQASHDCPLAWAMASCQTGYFRP
jgi:hypothetical protein